MPVLKYRKPIPEMTKLTVKNERLLEPSLLIELLHDFAKKSAHAHISQLLVANYEIEPALRKAEARIIHEQLTKVRAWTFRKMAKNSLTFKTHRSQATKIFYRYLQQLVLYIDWQDDSNAIGCPTVEHDLQIRFTDRAPLGMESTEQSNWGKRLRVKNRAGFEKMIKAKQLSQFYKDHDEDWTALRPYVRKFSRYWNPKTRTYWMMNPQGIVGELPLD